MKANEQGLATICEDTIGREYYLITAKRMTGQTMFYCESLNGPTMTPNAQSRAVRFGSRKEARQVLNTMSKRYRGLDKWRVEREVSP